MCTCVPKPHSPSPNEHVQLFTRNLLSGPITCTHIAPKSQVEISSLKTSPIFIVSVGDTIYSHTGPYQNPGCPSRTPGLIIHVQLNSEGCRNPTCVSPMPPPLPHCPRERPYLHWFPGCPAFTFTFGVEYHFSLPQKYDLPSILQGLFDGKDLAGLDYHQIITMCSFLPSALSYTVSLRGPEGAMYLHLHSIAQTFVSMGWLLLGIHLTHPEASIQTLLL